MATTTYALIPALPAHNDRYHKQVPPRGDNKDALNAISACSCPASLADGPAPLPKGFRPCPHPEGDVYFANDEKRVVTSSDVRDPPTADLILKVADTQRKSLYDKARDRLPQAELFLAVSFDDPKCAQVQYYWVDHATQMPFWTDNVAFEDLGLPSLQSMPEIKSRLLPEYWTHVEYHPTHLAVRLDAEDQLIGILSHGCVDNMTSPGSTFPFSAVECREYLKVIKNLRTTGMPSSSYRNAVVARIWNAVARARHINSYGLEMPRLDRLQGLDTFKQNQVQDNWKLATYEKLCFHLSLPVFDRLTSMWNGRVVYQRHWHVFFNDMRGDWQRVAALGSVIWLASITLIARNTVNVPAIVAAASSGASVFVSLVLCHKHRDDILASGPDISKYIMSVENYFHGLRPLSMIYIIPHTLALYGAIGLNAALAWSILQHLGIFSHATLLILILLTPIIPVIITLAFFDRTLDAKVNEVTDWVLDLYHDWVRKAPPPSSSSPSSTAVADPEPRSPAAATDKKVE